jgi:hypothetical protein
MGGLASDGRLRLRAFFGAISIVAATVAAQSSEASANTPFQVTLPVNPAQLSETKLNAALDMARDAGVTQVQAPATWWWIARAGQRSYEWSETDRLVDAAEARGLRVVMQITGTPDWVHPDLGSLPHQDRIWHPPVRNAGELSHWSDFVRDLMTRYRGRVAHYEIWNEQNWSDFWKPAPNPGDYAKLLRAAYLAGRQADPGASIVFGGMTTNDVGYLRAFYDRARSLWPAESAANDYYFDALGAHPYSAERSPRILDDHYVHQGQFGEVDRNFLGIRRLKSLMDAREGGGKQVYIGEYGFSTTRTWMEAVPDDRRAQYLRDAYALAAAEGYVTGMAWYGFVPNTGTPAEWATVDANLNPSQTFQALRDVPWDDPPSLIVNHAQASGEAEAATSSPAQPAAGVKSRKGPQVTVRRPRAHEYVAVVRCGSADCGAVAKGKLVASDQKRRKFRTQARASVKAGGHARLELKIPKKAQKAISRALSQGGRAEAEIKVKARDLAGNAVAKKRRAPVRA